MEVLSAFALPGRLGEASGLVAAGRRAAGGRAAQAEAVEAPLFLALHLMSDYNGSAMKVALDTNCFIDAVNSSAHAYTFLQVVLHAAHTGRLKLMVSLHSLHELGQKPDAAYELAKSTCRLPHWPVGTWHSRPCSRPC